MRPKRPNVPPTVVLAMVPAFTKGQFTAAHFDRLEEAASVPDREPLTDFGDERGRTLLARADVLLTGWGCPLVDEAALAAAPRLRAIVHAAGTVKPHVGEACWRRGLQVSSAAAANAVPVAEYALAAILFANKRAFRLQRRYRAVREYRPWPREAPGLGNYRKVVGLIGASQVGRRLLALLRPFDLELLLHDPYVGADEAAALGARWMPLDELLAAADVVSLHAPALPATEGMLDRRRLALLRDGAVLINTARGSLIDPRALTDELVAGRIDAVIDTTEPEILPADSPLYDLDNVFLTPHIAGALGGETRRLADHAIAEIERFARGEPFATPVRQEELERLA